MCGFYLCIILFCYFGLVVLVSWKINIHCSMHTQEQSVLAIEHFDIYGTLGFLPKMHNS